MKKSISIIILLMFLAQTRPAYAGEAWPWIVGGLAGMALLTSAVHHQNDHSTSVVTETHYVPQWPRHYTKRHYAHRWYSKRRHHKGHEAYQPSQIRTWHPGDYSNGHYHHGYTTYESLRACAY